MNNPIWFEHCPWFIFSQFPIAMGSRAAGASWDYWVMQIVEPDFNPDVGKIWKAHQRRSPARSAEQGESG
jgi:hypothetical protein